MCRDSDCVHTFNFTMIIKFITLSVFLSANAPHHSHTHASVCHAIANARKASRKRTIERGKRIILGSPTPNIFTQITVYNSFWTAFSFSFSVRCRLHHSLSERNEQEIGNKSNSSWEWREHDSVKFVRWDLSCSMFSLSNHVDEVNGDKYKLLLLLLLQKSCVCVLC